MGTEPELARHLAQARDFRQWADGHADEIETTQALPTALSARLRELGYFGITIPRGYGGLGLGLVGYAEIMAELSKAHAAIGGRVALNNMVASQVVLLGGTEVQKQRFLRPMATGEALAAFALTEPGAGSDAAGVSTRASRDGDHWVIDGMKHLIMHAPIADLVTVIASTEPERGAKGLSAFVVPRGTPGLRQAPAQRPMASRTTVGELHFEGCRVPADHLIGAPGKGFSLAMRALDMTRVGVGAYAVGSAERALELSVHHLQGRRQFGRPLAEQQGLQWMLAEMATDIAAARALLRSLAAKMDAGEPASADAAMLKLFASEMCGRVADKALQLHGGIAYLHDHPISRIYRDVRLWRIVDGTSEIQKTVIARELLAADQMPSGTPYAG
ncbi:MAG: acyl-CoA dehydrogenase family protein [Rubrivivax sp.]|nr:acyl-CoA dehydrogenase family protein [Rubrivivax sp.]